MTLGSGIQTGPSMVVKSRSFQPNGPYSGQRHFLDLPDDVIYVILSYCDPKSLGRLMQVCRRLCCLVCHDSVWLPMLRTLTAVRTKPGRWKRQGKVPVKEHCRFANNWIRGHFTDQRLIQHGVKQLPWLQADNHHLWVSYKNYIRCYQPKYDGSLRELPRKMLRSHREDVGRFICKDNMVVSGSRDGSIHAYSAVSGECLVQYTNCHSSDIQAVDAHHDIAISGSRDATIKIWSLQELTTQAAHQKTIEAHDRIWSLAMNPDGRSFTSGTAGINHIAPLRIWDTESGRMLAVLGSRYKHGAGVLDIQYETPNILLSCGYDTFTRMWDLRKSHTNCVQQFEEPFDSALYCVQSDGHHTVITGTARHGLVRLWDKRLTQPVQMYYVGRGSSPVYSMAYDAGHLYVALDRGINMLNFTLPG